VETDKDKINLSTPLFNIMKARDVLALSEGDPLVIELQYIKKNNKEDPDYSSSGEE
jgi:precorrin-6B methylase 1